MRRPPTESQSPSGKLAVEHLVEVVDVHPCVHADLAGRQLFERLLLDVVLVDDLAHELLDQVLEGDQPGSAAVLVDHDGEMESLGLHLAQQLMRPSSSRARSWRA